MGKCKADINMSCTYDAVDDWLHIAATPSHTACKTGQNAWHADTALEATASQRLASCQALHTRQPAVYGATCVLKGAQRMTQALRKSKLQTARAKSGF